MVRFFYHEKNTRYRIRNWTDYNQSLRQRGSLTFWISEELIDKWIADDQTGERGRSPTYSDAAIQAMACLKFVFQSSGQTDVRFGGFRFRVAENRVAGSRSQHHIKKTDWYGSRVAAPAK